MRIVAFDTETKGLDWFNPDQQAFLASWADCDGAYVADLSIPAQVSEFLAALESADIIVCHNLSFDVHQVRATLGWDALKSRAELHDTDLMARCIFPEGNLKGGIGFGLKKLAKKHIDPTADESESQMIDACKRSGIKLKETGGYYKAWEAWPELVERYALLDAKYTYDLFIKFEEMMTVEQAKIYALEQAVAPVLIEAEARGVALDSTAVERLRKEYKASARQLHGQLAEALGEEAIGGEGSEAALLEALQMQGIPLWQKTDSGQLATNQYALQEFVDDYPIIADLFAWRTATKFLSTYIDPMVDRSVVHPSFRQIGAWTGRMSCARPNMQNIPVRAGAEVREMFVPRKGYAFVVCDYDSIEVRLLAHYLGDAGFRQLIADGHDPHAWMASNLHGGKPADYEKGTDGEALRSAAKNSLFAITYGAGGKRITDMNKLDPGPYYDADHPAILEAQAQGRWWPKEGWQYAEGRALIRKIKGSLPNYNKLMKRIRAKIEDVGYVNTLWGRKNPVNKDKAYVGLNALIQGSAADVMKQGLLNVNEAVQPLGGHVLLVVHDEVVVEVPIDRAKECLDIVKVAMTEAYDLNPSLEVSGTIVTTNYGDAK